MYGHRDSSMGTMAVKKGQGEMSMKNEKLGHTNGVPRMLTAEEQYYILGEQQ